MQKNYPVKVSISRLSEVLRNPQFAHDPFVHVLGMADHFNPKSHFDKLICFRDAARRFRATSSCQSPRDRKRRPSRLATKMVRASLRQMERP